MNQSGWKPYDIGVMVRILPPEEKTTKGGIILTKNADSPTIESVQKGTLVDCGKLAFEGVPDKPQIGDEVFFSKYSGQFIYSYQSDDEQCYRVMDCHDIRATRGKDGR